MNIPLTAVATAAFLLAEANGERSRALFTVPANTDAMVPGTIVAADGTPATTAADAVGVLYGAVAESTAVQKATVIARDAEVHGELLAWPTGATDGTKAAYAEQLATVGIITRWTERPTGLETDAGLADDLPPVDPEP